MVRGTGRARRQPIARGLPGWQPGRPWPSWALFVWLELAATVEGGRALGLVLIGYTPAHAGRHGLAAARDRWREHAEVFSVWFGLLGRLAPYGLEGPAGEGSAAATRVRQRPRGLALVMTRCWPLVAIGAGSVIWDGVSQTQPWADLVGRPGLLGESLLLARVPGRLVVARGAAWRPAWASAAMGAGLVPWPTGYLVAHYLGFLLVDGQRIVVAISDPLQQGWDLFGTASLGARATTG